MPVTAERFLTVNEVAAEFRVSKRTVYRSIQRGELPVARFGKRIRVPVESLEELIRPVRDSRVDAGGES